MEIAAILDDLAQNNFLLIAEIRDSHHRICVM